MTRVTIHDSEAVDGSLPQVCSEFPVPAPLAKGDAFKFDGVLYVVDKIVNEYESVRPGALHQRITAR